MATSTGISASTRSIVSQSTAYQNGFHGILVSTGSTVERSVSSSNRNVGISAGTGCSITRNAAYDNGSDGINTELNTSGILVSTTLTCTTCFSAS